MNFESQLCRVQSSPLIGFDGTIYIGSNDNSLYALSTSATQTWKYTTGSAVFSSPAVSAAGTVYVGSNDGSLYAFPSGGTAPNTYTTGVIFWNATGW